MAITLEIHPAIGVARLGTSDAFFIGPEPGGAVPASFRDAAGHLLRQATRFRIYRCERDATGLLISCAEVTSAEATIQWTVTVANRKGVATKIRNSAGPRRNSATGNDASDARFIIQPTTKKVDGASPTASFDDGSFMGTQVSLGEIRMESNGRLIFLSGRGRSASPTGRELESWAESDEWHDDIADGPVAARVKLNASGETIDAIGAWVTVGPPKFAPELQNLVTLYDTLSEVAAGRGFVNDARIVPNPAIPAWDVDIQPILTRVLGYQWVNEGARSAHGPGGPGDFSSPAFAGIDDPANASAASARNLIFRALRVPGSAPGNAIGGANRRKMPRLYADEYLQQSATQQDRLPLTARQYASLQKWAAGNFVRTRPTQPPLEADLLTRLQLDSCVGGAFVPGIEVTFTVRNVALYMAGEPLRISHSIKPGSITENMAVPWQTDFTDCSWDAGNQLGWWPVQRPDVVTDSTGTAADWIRGFPSTNQNAVFHEMIDHWSELGIIARRDSGGNIRFVEVERTYSPPPPPAPAPTGLAEMNATIATPDVHVIHKNEEPLSIL